MTVQPEHSLFQLVEMDSTTSRLILSHGILSFRTLTSKSMEKLSAQLVLIGANPLTQIMDTHHAVQWLSLLKVKTWKEHTVNKIAES